MAVFPLVTANNSVPSSGFTYYEAPVGEGGLISQANATFTFRVAGELRYLSVYFGGSMTQTKMTYTVLKNGAATAMTLIVPRLAWASGWFEDLNLPHVVSIAAGDTIAFQVDVAANAPVGSQGNGATALLFLPTSNSLSLLGTAGIWGGATWNGTSVTKFGMYGAERNQNSFTTEGQASITIPFAATLSNLEWRCDENGRSSTTTIRSRVNGANGNQSLSYAAAETGVKEDTSNTDSVNANDTIAFAVTLGTGTGDFLMRRHSLHVVSTGGNCLLNAGINTSGSHLLPANSSRWATIAGMLTLTFVGGARPSAAGEQRFRVTGVATNLGVTVLANTLNGATTVSLFTNAVTSLSVSFASTETGTKIDTTHAVLVQAGFASIKYASAGSSGSMDVGGHWLQLANAVVGRQYLP